MESGLRRPGGIEEPQVAGHPLLAPLAPGFEVDDHAERIVEDRPPEPIDLQAQVDILEPIDIAFVETADLQEKAPIDGQAGAGHRPEITGLVGRREILGATGVKMVGYALFTEY